MSQELIQPYLFFSGRCEEAIAFYKQALGAEVEMLMRFKDSPDPLPADQMPPGHEDKVMHASLRLGSSPMRANTVMMSDGCGEERAFDGFMLSHSVSSEAEADRVFNALAEGGKITAPLGKTFWSPRFGMLTDRCAENMSVPVCAAE